MKKITLKCIAILLAFIMVIGSTSLSGLLGLDFSLKASAATWDIYTYEVNDGKVTITDCDLTASGPISIPLTIAAYPVVSIAERAFENCSDITSVSIPGTVKSMGDYAFYRCSGLITASTGGGVTSIGKYAFSYCSSLKIVDIGSGVKTIDVGAFYFCSSLMSVIIPDNVTSIGNKAFSTCNSLSSVTIGYNVTNIGDYAFYSCTSLVNFTVPTSSSTYSSENGILYNKSKSRLIQYPSGKTGSYTIPAGVTSIAVGAIFKCSALTSVVMGPSVTDIGYEMFGLCGALTSVTIGANVTSIGELAFENCAALTRVSIPNSVTTIGENAFYACSGMKNLNIPVSVTSIGVGAFSYCGGLTGMAILNSLTTIGAGAFISCNNLTIYGYTGSTAQTFADENNIPFMPVQIIMPASGSNCVVDTFEGFIYGLAPGLTKAEFEADYIQVLAGYTLEYTSNTIGTGTVVSAKESASGNTVVTYAIVIFGDATGDGNVDSIDAGEMVDYENNLVTWDAPTDAAYLKAADINGDGNVDSIDIGKVVDAENFLMTINQSPVFR